MAVSTLITVDDSRLRAAFARLSEAGADLREPLDEIGSMVETTVSRAFETERSPEGQPWPQSIRARVQGGQTLSDTGRLRRSITRVVEDRSVMVGTNVLYGRLHQLGGTITAKTSRGLRFRIGDQWANKKSVTIPARPFLPSRGLTPDDAVEAVRILEEHLASALGGAGGRVA